MKLYTMMTTLLLLGALAASGCSDEAEGLLVRGTVTVAIADAETGFSFAEDTRLADDALAEHDGPMSGHCTIDPSGSGDGMVELALVRPGEVEEGNRALRSFEATVEDGEGGAPGELSILLGEASFEATVGPSCALELIYVNTDTGQVGLEAQCLLESVDGEEADLAAELHFRNCDVLEN